MLEELINKFLPPLISVLEIMGIIVLLTGAFTAFYHYVKSKLIKDFYPVKYQFASSMAMALEFKLAAEILKTVIVRNIDELIVLGAIFLLRVLMTLVIEHELKQEATGKETSSVNVSNENKKPQENS